ncbi:MAG: ATP-binding protein [Angustibacter sp.]
MSDDRGTRVDRPVGGRDLLERDDELATMHRAVRDAAAGRGSVLLVSGEPGIGKTSVVRAFLAGVGRAGPADSHGVTVLLGSCDDLTTPRTLGPLRDAARGSGSALERALDAGDQDLVYGSLIEELGDRTAEELGDRTATELGGRSATVLVVEDVHWADDATLDVLRFLCRRVADLPAVVVLTFRPPPDGGAPLRHLLGLLAGCPVTRLSLRPLSASAVAELAGDRQAGRRLYAVTAGNPFYVAELLAAPEQEVPTSVVDMVQSRLRRLSPPARTAIERLSVVPSTADPDLVNALLGLDVVHLAEAEQHGVVQVGGDGVGFRHELVRRAVERDLPAVHRQVHHQAVLTALLNRPASEPARVVHHAAKAGDVPILMDYAPLAAREAARAGSRRQAIAHFETALRYEDRLTPDERVRVLDDYAWELHNAHRFEDAIRFGRRAVETRERLGDQAQLAATVLRLSRYLFMAGRVGQERAAIERAVRLAQEAGEVPALAAALAHRGAVLALHEQPRDAVRELELAHRLAERAGRQDVVALCLNYLGVAGAELGDPEAVDHLRRSLTLATSLGQQEYVARGWTNLVEVLYQAGRWSQAEAAAEEGLRYVNERGFTSHAYNLLVHRYLLMARRGAWDDAEAGLRALLQDAEQPGMLSLYSAPALGRLLARRGDPAAERLVCDSWHRAVRGRSTLCLAYAGIAYAEWAWITGRPDLAAQAHGPLVARLARPGAGAFLAEALRYLARCGVEVPPVRHGPPALVAGLRGRWRTAADLWDREGCQYEMALELLDGDDPAAARTALATLDRLGATAVAGPARRRLRRLGVSVPRGPRATTRKNPGGLTDRQVEILHLVAAGMTNAEIADHLSLSVRTVDHHVSAVLVRLDVSSRRQLGARAAELGLRAHEAAR